MEAYRMKRKMPIVWAFLLTMMSLTSSHANQSLKCFSDIIETVTCEWDSSVVDEFHVTPDTKCFLKGNLTDYYKYISVQDELVPLEDSKYEGTLRFSEKLTAFEPSFPVSVHCGKQTVAIIEAFWPEENIKLSPPEMLRVDGANVSWRLASFYSEEFQNILCSFQLQYRLLEEKWEDKDIVNLTAESCMLPEENLFLGKEYAVRVRSKQIYSDFWSDWSQTKWNSTVGMPYSIHNMSIFGLNGTVLVIILVTVLLVLFCIHPIVRFLKNLSKSKPSKYIDPLCTGHGWDFKSWLGPFVTTELFLKVDSEVICPVEVHEALSSNALYRKEDSGSQKGKRESNTSSFSNSTYFLSQSSKCKMVNHLDLCSPLRCGGPEEDDSREEKVLQVTDIHCNNDTDNESGLSSPLETSSSYKHLQKLRLAVQSPDSGFSPGADDQDSQEESGSEGLPSPPVVDNALTIRHVLPCPIPLEPLPGTFPHPLLSLSRLAWSPGQAQLLEIPPLCTSTSTLMPGFDLMACAGMVEPSSGDYMPVKKVQE